jgi:Cof subfamily protein (haloacid dehalogenase superfamily)
MPKLIAIDFDGTLFYPKKRIRLVSKENIQFIHQAIAAGHQVVFVTSRNREFVEKVQKQLGVQVDVVCSNGCMVIHQGQVIQDKVIDHKDVAAVVDYIQKRHSQHMMSIDMKQKMNLVYTSQYSWYLTVLYKFYYLIQGRYREDYIQDNALFMKEIHQAKTIQRLLIYFGLGRKAKGIAMDEAKHLTVQFPHLEIAWISSLLEIASKGTNKGNALTLLVQAKQIDPKDVMVVGDSGNDISMFHAFADSYCMAHAHPEVKQHAKTIIRRVHHLGQILNLK